MGLTARSGAVVALLVLVATVSGAVAQTDPADVYQVDADHGLASPDAVDRYDREGVASTELSQLDMRITVADDHDDVGLDGWLALDFTQQYLRLEYREEIPRTIRIYIPSEYFQPRVKRNLDALEGDVEADLEATGDQRYTAIVVRFEGPTDAVFPIKKAAGWVFRGRFEAESAVENETGWSLPSFGSDTQWQYVPDSAFAGNSTYTIPVEGENVTMQYDTARSTTETVWIPVPECKDVRDQDVCRFSREENEVTLLSTLEDPPTVRYKNERDSIADVDAWVNDLLEAPSRIGDLAGRLFGGIR